MTLEAQMTTLRDAIETQLNAVTDIGRVYDYWPLPARASQWIEYFGKEYESVLEDGEYETYIDAWIIEMVQAEQVPSYLEDISSYTATYRLHHYRSVVEEEPSEYGFIDMLMRVGDTMAAVSDFGAGDLIGQPHPAMVRQQEPRIWGQILCHYGYVELLVRLDVE